ncbi:MAG: ribonuclease E/G, partial [Sphingomonas sp.]
MAEWLYEAGIGEARAALVEGGAIVEARIELDDGAPRAGAVLSARLVDASEGRVALACGGEALLNGAAGVTQGAQLTVRIVREALTEPGRLKPARAIPVDAEPGAGLDLLGRITETGIPVRQIRAHDPDLFEAAGWSEILEEARTGDIAFPGGMLRMIPTAAMTLFDVDGSGDLASLAIAAATAVARAIRRHDIGGSIGVDFPTLPDKSARQAVAAALDTALPPPFERTTVNG